MQVEKIGTVVISQDPLTYEPVVAVHGFESSEGTPEELHQFALEFARETIFEELAKVQAKTGKVLADCYDCGVKPGQTHEPGCDVERCSVCGGQWLSCGHEGHDPAFSRWTGFWPGELEARALGVDLNGLHGRGWHRVLFVKPSVPEEPKEEETHG